MWTLYDELKEVMRMKGFIQHEPYVWVFAETERWIIISAIDESTVELNFHDEHQFVVNIRTALKGLQKFYLV